MTTPLEPLPDFANPPVVETVLSVQFDALPAIQTAHLGLLWHEYRDAFPRTEERPALDPVIERFPESPAARVGLRLESYDKPPVPRLWFTSTQGNEMVQVQNDRFIKNWRKEGAGAEYPRYDKTIRPNFDRDYAVFLSFLEENQLGAPRVTQCEVTYVNHILAGEGWRKYGDLDKIFTFWKPPAIAPPGQAEDLTLHTRFVIAGEDGKAIGRLHIDVQPAVRTADNQPMYVFNLTARGQLGDSLDFFEVGHTWIVHSFAALTTPTMHDIWRRK